MSTKIHPKMSTKIHPKRGLLVDKSVHENSPKVSTRIHQKCPREFALYVHEKSATRKFDAKHSTIESNNKYFSRLQNIGVSKGFQ
jgi:hypothetical protein